MKVGDLVKSKLAPTPIGVIISICDDLGVNTIDILSTGNKIIYDQREDFYEVMSEDR